MYFLRGPRRRISPGILIAIFLTGLQCCFCDIKLSTSDISVKLSEKKVFYLEAANVSATARLTFVVQHEDIVKITPSSISLTPTSVAKYNLTAEATSAGHSEITINATDGLDVADLYVRVTVYKSASIDTISIVIGWIYFAAWSISFYPQIYINYKRKSVVGYNIDYGALNVVGYTSYTIFNLGLFCVPAIQGEYFARYPLGSNPVQLNDVFFTVHGTGACIWTLIQCCVYERRGQKVSTTTKSIIGILVSYVFGVFCLTTLSAFSWLDFLYYTSYVKLVITLLKYMPQILMNYRRKSTIGWSIGGVMLDLLGGIFSMSQMFLCSYNYDEWISIFGNPTKFSLGLFTVVLNLIFVSQHYVWYKDNNYDEM